MSSKNNDHIIAFVKRYPLLYDPAHPEYKSQHAKNKTWEIIGHSLKMTGEEAKSKWKNLRDTYSKYLKCNRSVDTSIKNRFGRWQWGPAMDFLKDHIGTYSSDNTASEQETENHKDVVIENNIDYGYYAPPSRVPLSTPESKSQIEKVILSLNDTANRLSSTEHIMIGYAKVLDGMTVQRRIQTKMKFAQIMMQAELEEEEERLRQQDTEFHLETDPISDNRPFIVCKTDIDED